MTRRVALAGLLALAAATPARASFIVYTSQASYLAALAPNPVTDTYNDLVPHTGVGSPLSRSGNGLSYVANALNQGVPGDFVVAGTTADPWLSTKQIVASIAYSTFSSTVRGVGGFFFGSDASGAFLAGTTINITAVDGSQTLTQTLTATSTFFGVISNGPITSFTVRATSAFPTANDFIIGAAPTAAVPAPPTLLLGLVGAGCAGVAWLRRRGR